MPADVPPSSNLDARILSRSSTLHALQVHRFEERAPFCEVKLSVNEDDPDVWVRGHERQQYSQFHADLYVDASFVGFVDTDTLFVTPVTTGDLFDPERRPLIIAQVGRPADDFWSEIPALTRGILKRDHICRGMSYFPVREIQACGRRSQM